MPRHASKVDVNHPCIRDALRELGFKVADTSSFGEAFPDLMVRGYHYKLDKQIAMFVEIKYEYNKASEDQKRWHGEWGVVLHTCIAWSLAEVLMAFGWEKEMAETTGEAYEC